MRSFVLLLVLAVALSAPASAQQKSASRPFSEAPEQKITRLDDIRTLLNAESNRLLLEAAEPAGVAAREVLAASPRRELGRSAAKSGVDLRLRITRSPNEESVWIEGAIGKPHLYASVVVPPGKFEGEEGGDKVLGALAVLAAYRESLLLDDPPNELSLVRTLTDDLGYTHVRFQQEVDGIPVWGRDVIVHFNRGGEVYAMNGSLLPTPAGLSSVPEISPESARERVQGDLEARGRWAPVSAEIAEWLGIAAPQTNLVVYPDGRGRAFLAYEVTLHPNLLEWYSYFVDAKTGAILNVIQRHCTLLPESAGHTHGPITASGPAPSFEVTSTSAGSFHGATGTDLHGSNASFRTWRNGSGTYYKVSDLDNLNASASTLPDNPAGGAVTITANNKDFDRDVELFHVTSTGNQWQDPAAVSAHVNMQVAYEYYKGTFGRKAIDDRDQSIISIVHVTDGGRGMDNAFWTGRVMAYGNGETYFRPLAGSLNVAGHEMSHGVIEHTAGLVYQFQPGALNESFADVFGVLIERGGYLIGHDIMKSAHVALRDLQNPDNTQVLSPQPAHMNAYQNLSADQDHGGVHINSGIPNRAAYLIINALGPEKAENIYYRALSTYLTRNSQFIDARKGIERAALDLYGEADAAVVRSAFDSVGIVEEGTPPPPGGAKKIPPVVGGTQVIAFTLADGRIGGYNLASGEAFLFQSANAVVRTNDGDISQLSTPLSGERIWFVNNQNRLAFISTASGEVSVFNDLHLFQPGDLWNAVVAPDESHVALVSAYSEDPNLYFFNGEDIFLVELKPEGTQPGVYDETIQYPDVVTWSPNMQIPKVAFDALNLITVGNTDVTYWSMYEIDFGVSKVYNLVPSQPSNISVGNVTYGNTNPDRISFNVFDENGADIWFADFDEGHASGLGIFDYALGGVPIVDAVRPTFSPADDFLAFTSEQHQAFLFYNLATQGLSYLSFAQPLYNPRWFVVGGMFETSTEEPDFLPSDFLLHGSYPNPFNPSTTIRFELPHAADISLEVFDMLGRRVTVVSQGLMPAGVHEVRYEASSLPSGSYMVRLSGGGTMQTHKMVLLR